MATLKYKTPEGEWKKVSIGGGGSTEEVYVGSDEPTDENVKVWIDPTGTPSGGNGGSSESGGGLNVYCLPVEIMAGTADAPYDFGELSESFIKALGNLETIYLLTASDNVGSQSIAFTNRIAVPQSDGTIKVTLSCAVPSFLNQTQVYVTYMEININVNGANVSGYYRYTGKQI